MTVMEIVLTLGVVLTGLYGAWRSGERAAVRGAMLRQERALNEAMRQVGDLQHKLRLSTRVKDHWVYNADKIQRAVNEWRGRATVAEMDLEKSREKHKRATKHIARLVQESKIASTYNDFVYRPNVTEVKGRFVTDELELPDTRKHHISVPAVMGMGHGVDFAKEPDRSVTSWQTYAPVKDGDLSALSSKIRELRSGGAEITALAMAPTTYDTVNWKGQVYQVYGEPCMKLFGAPININSEIRDDIVMIYASKTDD